MKHSQIDAGPVQLHVVEHVEGPPVLLVHGTTADHTRWARVLPAFEEHYTVFATILLATVNGMAVECAADPEAVTEEQVTESIAAVLRAALAP